MADGRGARVRVVLLFGGRSSEHAISCVSAGSILRALDRERYEVLPVGITVDGAWVEVPDEADALAITEGRLPAVDPAGVEVALRPRGGSAVLRALAEGGEGAVDVVFPVLHGPWGEDGTVQGLLELAGLPYVGSGVFASAAGMDKGHMKTLLAAAGLPVGPYEVITDRQWRADREAVLARCAALAGSPVGALFVKPARAGSSIGITKVHDLADLPAAIDEARRHDPKVVVEASIEGVREIECAVLVVDGVPQASRCAEIVVSGDHEFYDFEAKYLDDAADLIVPADLPADVEDRVRAAAIGAFDALGCEGLARVDFFVRSDGSVVVNEVNTMPGFTSISMFPRMWAATGVEYPRLLDLLLEDALRRGAGLH